MTDWPKLTRAQCVDLHVPGGVLPVHPALAPIFADLAQQYHDQVEPLVWPGCWGWAGRNIAGTNTPSKHWRGVAIDLCAPQHPQGVPVGKTFTRGQVSAVSGILARYHGLIVWGGTWSLPSTDGMHFELRDGATFAEVTALAATLAQHPAPSPPPPAPTGWTGPDLVGVGPALRGDQGNNGPRVQSWQAWLAHLYPAYRHAHGELVPDGYWGPITSAWNAEFGRRSGIPSADGLNIGPKLAAAYHRAGLFRQLSAARQRAVGHIYRAERR